MKYNRVECVKNDKVVTHRVQNNRNGIEYLEKLLEENDAIDIKMVENGKEIEMSVVEKK